MLSSRFWPRVFKSNWLLRVIIPGICEGYSSPHWGKVLLLLDVNWKKELNIFVTSYGVANLLQITQRHWYFLLVDRCCWCGSLQEPSSGSEMAVQMFNFVALICANDFLACFFQALLHCFSSWPPCSSPLCSISLIKKSLFAYSWIIFPRH